MVRNMLIHRILIILCSLMLILPVGAWSVEAEAAAIAAGYKYEQTTPEKHYAFSYIKDVDTDSEGHVYVADYFTHLITKLDGNGTILSTWMGDNNFQPTAIAVSATDAVYAASGGSIKRIDVSSPGSSPLTIGNEAFGYISGLAIDRSSGTLYAAGSDVSKIWLVDDTEVTYWDSYTDSSEHVNDFEDLTGIAVDGNGDVYVLENGNHIIKLSPNGSLISEFTAIDFNNLAAIEVDADGTLYAVDNDEHVVVELEMNGITQVVGEEGTKNTQFHSPSGIAVDDNGIVYVADTDNKRIQKLGTSLNHLASWGSLGGEPGQFNKPTGIAVDPDGAVYVADYENYRVQKFDNQFEFLEERNNPADPESFIPHGVASDQSGDIYITTDDGQLYRYDASEDTTTVIADGFYEPQAVAVDNDGYIYVADTVNSLVIKLDPEGEHLNSWSGGRDAQGFSFRPQGIAVDLEREIVYVSDSRNIQTFDLEGFQLETSWGQTIEEPEDSTFGYIRGIALDSVGNLYVTDEVADVISKFDPAGNLLTSWGVNGSGEGELNGVGAIAVDSSGNVYITETVNHRIQKFAYELNHLSGLTVSEGTLDTTFDPSIMNFNVSVAGNVEDIKLTPEALHSGTLIKVNGEVVASGDESAAITLEAGVTVPVIVEVTGSDRQKRTYSVNITRAAILNSALSTNTAIFDGNTANQTDVTTTLTLNGNTLTNIQNGGAVLSSATDYTVSGNIVTIKAVYLATQAVGTTNLTFNFSAGSSQTMAITIRDTTPPPTSGSGGSGGAVANPSTNTSDSAQEEDRQVNVETDDFDNTVKINIKRKRSADGKKTDIVSLDDWSILEFAKKAAESGRKTARIVIDDLPNEPADAVSVNLSRKAVSILGDYGIHLEIQTGDTIISLSKETIALLKTDAKEVVFNMVPVYSAEELNEITKRVLNSKEVMEASPNGAAEVVGKPMKIDASYEGRATKLVFPLTNIKLPSDPTLLEQFLSSLAVYIEHSDGDKVLQRGLIVYDASGKPIGYEIAVSKFSTFTLVNLHDAVIYERYILGSSEGMFNPDQSVTRAELAAILDRNLDDTVAGLVGKSFPDVAATHWASASITLMKSSGIMQGDQLGLFHPNAAVTRAEMARIIATWKKLPMGQGNSPFSDTGGRWASQAIVAVQAEGWMVGYNDGTFAPNRPLTRAEAVRILNRLLERPSLEGNKLSAWKDVPLTHWAYDDIETASRTFVKR